MKFTLETLESRNLACEIGSSTSFFSEFPFENGVYEINQIEGGILDGEYLEFEEAVLRVENGQAELTIDISEVYLYESPYYIKPSIMFYSVDREGCRFFNWLEIKILVPGNPVEYNVADFNQDNVVNIKDVDMFYRVHGGKNNGGATDLNKDGKTDDLDVVFMLKEAGTTNRCDINLKGDGFNSGDLTQAFVGGKYATGLRANWSDGNFNYDSVFDSSDLVYAFNFCDYQA